MGVKNCQLQSTYPYVVHFDANFEWCRNKQHAQEVEAAKKAEGHKKVEARKSLSFYKEPFAEAKAKGMNLEEKFACQAKKLTSIRYHN